MRSQWLTACCALGSEGSSAGTILPTSELALSARVTVRSGGREVVEGRSRVYADAEVASAACGVLTRFYAVLSIEFVAYLTRAAESRRE